MGIIFGSFANVIIHRIPLGISIISPPSHCPDCGRGLSPWELVPVISYILLRGKCRCGAKISLRYPLVELACGLLWLAVAIAFPFWDAVPLALLAFALLCVAIIDAKTMLIPDGLNIFIALLGILWVVSALWLPTTPPDWQASLFGLLAGGLPLLIVDRLTIIIAGKDGFGYGDVKLMAACGLLLGWQLVLVAFFFAFTTGAIFALWLIVTGRAKRGAYMPFGPFLCGGVMGGLFFGDIFISFLFVQSIFTVVS
ncbi:MAG: prepilin peptidase [Defluviitaleaceae bacterium]|nr:prepilin peptidase [Defluviitaleaceae bacterium]